MALLRAHAVRLGVALGLLLLDGWLRELHLEVLRQARARVVRRRRHRRWAQAVDVVALRAHRRPRVLPWRRRIVAVAVAVVVRRRPRVQRQRPRRLDGRDGLDWREGRRPRLDGRVDGRECRRPLRLEGRGRVDGREGRRVRRLDGDGRKDRLIIDFLRRRRRARLVPLRLVRLGVVPVGRPVLVGVADPVR